ncbi:MAG: hypothetical protein ACR2RF_32155 [Geminicoccaceae bacterium]
MSEQPAVTIREAAFLHEQGWSSGFGWERDLEWWRVPSYGPDIWITEDAKYMAQWLEDRESYRRMLISETAQAHALDLMTALENIAYEAGQYADGAEDAHYLAKELANLEGMARAALVPFKKLENGNS